MLLLDNDLLTKIWNDPFEYAFGAVMVVLALGWVVRTVRSEILGTDDED